MSPETKTALRELLAEVEERLKRARAALDRHEPGGADRPRDGRPGFRAREPRPVTDTAAAEAVVHRVDMIVDRLWHHLPPHAQTENREAVEAILAHADRYLASIGMPPAMRPWPPAPCPYAAPETLSFPTDRRSDR